jgi:hypothetical protein
MISENAAYPYYLSVGECIGDLALVESTTDDNGVYLDKPPLPVSWWGNQLWPTHRSGEQLLAQIEKQE